MIALKALAPAAALSFLASIAPGGEATPRAAPAPGPAAPANGPDWLTGDGASIGGIFSPHFHFGTIYGGTTADELPATGHHDPRQDGWTIQGFELGMSARFTPDIEAFGAFHLFYDNETRGWGHEFEE